MSTKIYDAYKYNGSLYTLLIKLKELREVYQETLDEEQAKMLSIDDATKAFTW